MNFRVVAWIASLLAVGFAGLAIGQWVSSKRSSPPAPIVVNVVQPTAPAPEPVPNISESEVTPEAIPEVVPEPTPEPAPAGEVVDAIDTEAEAARIREAQESEVAVFAEEINAATSQLQTKRDELAQLIETLPRLESDYRATLDQIPQILHEESRAIGEYIGQSADVGDLQSVSAWTNALSQFRQAVGQWKERLTAQLTLVEPQKKKLTSWNSQLDLWMAASNRLSQALTFSNLQASRSALSQLQQSQKFFMMELDTAQTVAVNSEQLLIDWNNFLQQNRH